MATKPRRGGGGGLKALVAGPLRKELFFAASLSQYGSRRKDMVGVSAKDVR